MTNNTKKSTLKIICKTLIFVFVVILFIVCFVLSISQKYIFFHPRNDLSSYEQLHKISDFEEVNIISDGKNLNWWIYYNNPKWEKSPLVIYFGGNAQNSSNTMAYYFDSWIFEYFGWYNVLMVDYPEYWREGYV